MTTGQAPIRIKTGNALDVEDTTSNVAINQAMMEALSAANIDGKDVYPNYVGAQHLSAADAIIHGAFKAGSMMIGAGGVNISSAEDGETPTTGLYMGGSLFSLYKSGVSQVTLDGQTGNASFKGTVYADAGSFPGSLVTGNISVASGGVTISNDGGASGIYIGANQIYCKAGGVTKFLLNGATGEITAYKFTLVADSASQLNLGSGTHVFADSIQVGGTPGVTLGTMKTGIGTAQSTADTAKSTANTAKSTADSALSEAQGRIKPGGGVTVDGDKYITTIDMSGGIVIKTGTSTAKTQMTSKGIAIYNSDGTCVVQADHSNGVWVNNASSTPGVTERVSCAYGGSEVGYLAAYSGSLRLISLKDNPLWVGGYGDLNLMSNVGDVYLFSGDSSKTLYLGYSSYPFGRISLNGSVTVEVGSAPTQGAASGLNSGSLRLATGGSLWLVDGSGKWDRVRTKNYNP